MNKDIKDIVTSLRIKEKKEQLLKNRNKLLVLKTEMEKLTFDVKVARYIFLIDEIEYYKQVIRKNINNTKEDVFKKINDDEIEISKLEKKSIVQKYIALINEYYTLWYDNEYYLTLNIDFRDELAKIGLPRIYVKQHDWDFNMNIIDRAPFLEEFAEEDSLLIYPPYNLRSSRNYRHFYNRISFRYLKQVSEDFCYDLENKDLGNVKILTIKK